jgi:phasin
MNDTVEKKVKQTAREATERVEESATKATEGLRDCQTKIIAATQANVNAMFEYAQEALKAKSMPELVELSTTYSRRQLELMTEQAREITGAAQKLVTESASPLTTGFTKTFGQMS